MTLATMRSLLWRGGGDIILYYKLNGRRELSKEPVPPASPPAPAVQPLSPLAATSPPSTTQQQQQQQGENNGNDTAAAGGADREQAQAL